MGHGVEGHSTAARIDLATARVIAEQMQMLATPSRVLILARLREQPMSVGDLAAAVGMQQSAVSQQLRQLRQLGMVIGERQGRNVVYGLHDAHVAEVLEQAAYHVEHLRLGDRQLIPGANRRSA